MHIFMHTIASAAFPWPSESVKHSGEQCLGSQAALASTALCGSDCWDDAGVSIMEHHQKRTWPNWQNTTCQTSLYPAHLLPALAIESLSGTPAVQLLSEGFVAELCQRFTTGHDWVLHYN